MFLLPTLCGIQVQIWIFLLKMDISAGWIFLLKTALAASKAKSTTLP